MIDGKEEKRITVAHDCVMLGQCYERHDAACCTDIPISFSTRLNVTLRKIKCVYVSG